MMPNLCNNQRWTSESLLAIRWVNCESEGYIDVFSLSIFKNEGESIVTHLVLGPQSGQYQAKCRLLVHDNLAELDYEAFPDFNKQKGMFLGVLRLHFVDKTRTGLAKSDWKDPGKKSFVSGYAEVLENLLPALPKYKLKKEMVKKTPRKISDRPGQTQFRNILMLAYEGRCCVSGCSVGEALEGAHIDLFSGKSSNHPQNGLLIRKDLHALFDAGLLAIDPTSLLIYFAPTAQEFPEYKKLHSTARLALPVYGGTSYHPSSEALRRRWHKFDKKNHSSKSL